MAYTQVQKITSTSPGADNNYGSRVVIDGYHAAVTEANASRVWLYRRDLDGVWKSRVSGGLATAGSSLSMNGDYLVVGDISAGAVYVYDKNTTTDTKLATLGPHAGEDFGDSVVISDNYIIVGAPAKDLNVGGVYVYEKTGKNIWTAYSGNPLTSDIKNPDDFFGTSVGTNEVSIVVGASGDNNKKGAVYIFEEDQSDEEWKQVQKLFASDGSINDEFGLELSVSEDLFVAGARLSDDDNGDANAGAAYVFKYVTNWFEIVKLTGISETDFEGNRFGTSVYIDEKNIIVGSPRARNAGVADVFRKERSWNHLKKILGSDTSTADDFGNSVSISGRFIIVGSLDNDGATTNSGAAYIYEDPQIVLRSAQEFEVNGEYLPSKASVYLKKAGKNVSNYFLISNTNKTVIDATNFSTITEGENVIILDDAYSNFTGNGYMILDEDNPSIPDSSFSVLNYPIRASESDTFRLWVRCLSTISDNFNAEILIDGVVIDTLSESVSDPSDLRWNWIGTTLVLPDTREHILGIKIKENGAAIDKIYIDASVITPYSEGPDYTTPPYLTIHMKVYESENNAPSNALHIYDYKNSITEVVQSDWYNFDITVLDNSHGYQLASDFLGSYYLVLSVAGSYTGNFVVWEITDVDDPEYNLNYSALRI